MIEGLGNINMNMDKYLGYQKDIPRQKAEEMGITGSVDRTKKEGNLIPESVKEASASDESHNDNIGKSGKEMGNSSGLKTNIPQYSGIGNIIDKVI